MTMINRKFLKLFLKFFSLLTILGVVGVLWVMFGLYDFLAQNERVDAEVLVVEGWLPEYALEEAYEEFRSHPYKKILTTGGPIDSIFRMHSNGSLHIQLPDSVTAEPAATQIIVEAQGRDIDGVYPHFSVWINDTICVGEAFTWWHNRTFVFPLEPGTPAISTVQIKYDNDGVKGRVDRDMYFRSVTVNNHRATYLAGDMVYEYISPYSGEKIAFSEKTMAETAAFYLRRMGLTEDELIAIPSPPVPVHRTYTSAIALKEWLKENNVKAVNVLSLGTHARRSCLSYKKVLRDQDDLEIGVIALEDKDYDPDRWWRVKRSRLLIMREALKYTYIQFFFDIV